MTNSTGKFTTKVKRNVLIGGVLILIIASVAVGLKTFLASEQKTTKLGFEDIGELATQSAYCTQVNTTEADRKLFNLSIPFTQSKYIYSYDFIIKAGMKFDEIKWYLKGETIEVYLPEAEILSSEPVYDSFKVYHEDESAFRNISLEENNEAVKEMQKNAEKDAVANGLLENAEENAEVILKEFFAQQFDLEKYHIEFIVG